MDNSDSQSRKEKKDKKNKRHSIKCAKVPGNLTCAAHSIFLSLFATAMFNPKWFESICDVVIAMIRRMYNVDGTETACQVRTHMLRDLVVETVQLRGKKNFKKTFGDSWYWGPEVEADICGIIEETRENPASRGFIEHANPFFMVCSFLFKCKIEVIMDNGRSQIFMVPGCAGPIIKVRNNAQDRVGTHFDALIPDNLPKIWFIDLNIFYKRGAVYIFEGQEYCDVDLKIDDWYTYLGYRYFDVIDVINASKERQLARDKELAERLAFLTLQIEKDAELARKLSRELNGE